MEARVRGLAPKPGAWFEYKRERFRVLSTKVVEGKGIAGSIINENLTIACGEKALNILKFKDKEKKL